MDVKQIEAKASALGYSFQRGLRKGAGYVLTDSHGDKPLGDGYTASLADIARYLDDLLSDLDEPEVETGVEEAPAPLSDAQIRRSLRGHDNADEIDEVLNPAPISKSKEEKREQKRRDSVILGPREGWRAFALMSEQEKRAFSAKAEAARVEEERLEKARLPKEQIPIRTTGLNADHPLKAEAIRKQNEFRKADERLKTNIASIRDRNEDDDERCRDTFGDPDKEHMETIREAEAVRARILSLQEDDAQYQPAPKSTPIGNVAVVSTVRRLSRSERASRRRLLELRSEIVQALARSDQTKVGAMLREAKDLLDHGDFVRWIENELNISPRTAQRHMAKI